MEDVFRGRRTGQRAGGPQHFGLHYRQIVVFKELMALYSVHMGC